MTREEAIEVYHGLINTKIKEAFEFFAPELKESKDESKDERIRNKLYCTVLGTPDDSEWFHDVSKDSILAYLEKQKEQKPTEQGVKGRRGRIGTTPEFIRKKAESFQALMEPPYDADDICSAYETGAMENVKLVEWTAEDEENFEWFDKFFRAESVIAGGKDIPQDKYFWFKSLRPQPQLKDQEPEGVQGDKGTPGLAGIEAVEGVVHHVMNSHYIFTNGEQLSARLREIPEGTKVNILIYEAEEEGK